MVLAHVTVLAHVKAFARFFGGCMCYGVNPCYCGSPCYGVSPCYSFGPCYGVKSTIVWVTWPECFKRVKDEVKRPKVPPGSLAPKTSIQFIFYAPLYELSEEA